MTDLLRPGRLARRTLLFFGLFLLGDRLVHALNRIHPFDCPVYWPLSVFNFRHPKPLEAALAAATALAAALAVRSLETRRYPGRAALLCGLGFVLATNFVQGWEHAVITPIDGGGKSKIQYYRDTLRIESAGKFLAEFNQIQPDLLIHSRTHPPGAVLLHYGLRRLFGPQCALFSLTMAVFCVLGGGMAFRRLLRALDFPEPAASFGTLLLLCLPAVSLYFCASIDGVLCALFLIALAAHLSPARPLSLLVGAGATIGASFLSFGWMPLLAGMAAIDGVRRSGWRSGAILAGVAGFYLLLYRGGGFDYLQALRAASALENPLGPRFLWQPYVYAMTRLEDVAEIVLFFGPLTGALAWRGLPLLNGRPRVRALALAIPIAVLALFLSGAYHTGETARACLFVQPCLLLPALLALPDTPAARTTVLTMAMAQTLLMQLLGRYFW